jgi:hypothetical protein
MSVFRYFYTKSLKLTYYEETVYCPKLVHGFRLNLLYLLDSAQTLSDEYIFYPYLTTVAPALYEARIELLRVSQNRFVAQKLVRNKNIDLVKLYMLYLEYFSVYSIFNEI